MHEWRGTRDELVTELRRAADGWIHYGKPHLAAEARNGVEELETGGSSVQVGHAKYVVTED